MRRARSDRSVQLLAHCCGARVESGCAGGLAGGTMLVAGRIECLISMITQCAFEAEASVRLMFKDCMKRYSSVFNFSVSFAMPPVPAYLYSASPM